MALYKSQVVCRICDVTPRMLDYWVTTELIRPESSYRGKAERRDFFLFTFQDLVRIRIVRSLRLAGVTLQKIRIAISKLESRRGDAWQAEWLATDGRDVYVVADNGVLESLANGNSGQLAFAVVAVGEARRVVTEGLKRVRPFEARRLPGRIHAVGTPLSGMRKRGGA